MKAHLAGSVLTLAVCWRVTRKDGAVFGFTSLDVPLDFEGVTYSPQTGISPTSTVMSADGAVANSELMGVLNSDLITEQDLEAGLWSYAEISVFLVNWADLSMGAVPIQQGNLGQVKLQKGSTFAAEMRSMGQLLQLPLGDLDVRTCPQRDCACLVEVAKPENLISGAVTSVAYGSRVFSAAARTEPAHYFRYGKLTFTSGANSGLSQEVFAFSSGVFTLLDAMPHAITVGDTFKVSKGIDGTTNACKSVWGNLHKFGGTPYVLGPDILLTPANHASQ